MYLSMYLCMVYCMRSEACHEQGKKFAVRGVVRRKNTKRPSRCVWFILANSSWLVIDTKKFVQCALFHENKLLTYSLEWVNKVLNLQVVVRYDDTMVHIDQDYDARLEKNTWIWSSSLFQAFFFHLFINLVRTFYRQQKIRDMQCLPITICSKVSATVL